jgi:hypothetical protein
LLLGGAAIRYQTAANCALSCFSCALRVQIGRILAKRGCEINLVILFVDQDLPDLFSHGELVQCLALSHALARAGRA